MRLWQLTKGIVSKPLMPFVINRYRIVRNENVWIKSILTLRSEKRTKRKAQKWYRLRKCIWIILKGLLNEPKWCFILTLIIFSHYQYKYGRLLFHNKEKKLCDLIQLCIGKRTKAKGETVEKNCYSSCLRKNLTWKIVFRPHQIDEWNITSDFDNFLKTVNQVRSPSVNGSIESRFLKGNSGNCMCQRTLPM